MEFGTPGLYEVYAVHCLYFFVYGLFILPCACCIQDSSTVHLYKTCESVYCFASFPMVDNATVVVADMCSCNLSPPLYND
jgi:hypothetical protein